MPIGIIRGVEVKMKEGNFWNHVLKQYKEVGSHAHMEEWAVAGGSSLTGGKVAGRRGSGSSMKWERGDELRVRVEKGMLGV